MTDSDLHLVLGSGLSAVGVVAGWSLLTTIRLDKQVAVLEKGVNANGGLADAVKEATARLEKLIDKLDERIEKLEAR